MPVIMNLPRPTVNYVGNTEIAPHSPALDPNGFERRKPQFVKMRSPDGEIEDVLADNVRDFERLKNYTRLKVKNPAPVVGVEANSLADEAPETVAAQSKINDQTDAMEYLTSLRTVLTDLNVEVDKRWGIARLRKEIEERGVTVPERTETDE